MFSKFLPKQEKFFQLLSELVDNILEAVNLLNTLFEDHHTNKECASQIHILENKCDDLTHRVITELNETFITPIDREDIYALTNSLDNIIDTVDAIATRLTIYKIKTPIAFGTQLAGILQSQMIIIAEVVKDLKNRKDTFKKLIEVRNLETEGDLVFREAIAQLFDTEKDIAELIKKKEILENIERSVDCCQTATVVVESILIKNV